MKEKESKGGNTRARFFALVTYRTDTQGLVKTIQDRANSIRAYALIKHDKDETDLHHHMVLRTHCTWTCPQVAKWFADDSEQNTFAQIVRDRQGIIDYLTHEHEHAESGKAHYDKSDIIDGGLSDILPLENVADDSYEIIQAMLEGRSTRDLCRMYGRDFIYHYSSYAMIADVIRKEEGAV